MFTGRYRIRTCDPLIKSQLPQNDKRIQNKDLEQDTTETYKPAYKENSKADRKQDKIESTQMPPEIAEIVAVWPELPEHIKAAIKALVQTHKAENE